MEENKWYFKPWTVTIVMFLFWPVGLYGLFKGQQFKPVLSRFFGILGCCAVFALLASSGSKHNGNSGLGMFDNVSNSQWDGSVSVAEDYLKNQLLKDPDSYQSIKWGKVSKNPDGSYQVTHTYRARNGFGGMNKSTVTFVINSAGTKVINYWEEH